MITSVLDITDGSADEYEVILFDGAEIYTLEIIEATESNDFFADNFENQF